MEKVPALESSPSRIISETTKASRNFILRLVLLIICLLKPKLMPLILPMEALVPKSGPLLLQRHC